MTQLIYGLGGTVVGLALIAVAHRIRRRLDVRGLVDRYRETQR